MEQLIELLKQIQELAGVAIEALQGAGEGAAAGAEGGGGAPHEGGAASRGAAPRGGGGEPARPPSGGGTQGAPPEGPPPGREQWRGRGCLGPAPPPLFWGGGAREPGHNPRPAEKL